MILTPNLTGRNPDQPPTLGDLLAGRNSTALVFRVAQQVTFQSQRALQKAIREVLARPLTQPAPRYRPGPGAVAGKYGSLAEWYKMSDPRRPVAAGSPAGAEG